LDAQTFCLVSFFELGVFSGIVAVDVFYCKSIFCLQVLDQFHRFITQVTLVFQKITPHMIGAIIENSQPKS
jgi:hypothetical protein